MSSTVSHYQLSHKFNPLLTIVFTIIGIFVAIALGIIYSIISYYSPFVIIDIGLVVVMGLTLAYLASFLAKAAKVRNTMVNFFMAFFICLFAYYSSVCGFEVGLFSGDFTDYINCFFHHSLSLTSCLMKFFHTVKYPSPENRIQVTFLV